jgi:hypothetical protein
MSSSSTQQNAFNSGWQRHTAFQEMELFPDENATNRDTSMHACGLIRGYELLEKGDDPTQAPNKKHAHSQSRHNKIATVTNQNDPEIRLPNISSFALAAQEIIKEPFFEVADTILLITDTDELNSTRIKKHFDKIGPLLFDRTTIQGPYAEQWAIAFHKTDRRDEMIHCTWSAVFLLEALVTAVPWKHYVLQDHDDTPTSLFEIKQLVNFVSTFHLPYFSDTEAHPGLISQNEESTPNNAGQVIFAARDTRKQSTQMSAQEILAKLNQERSELVARKFPAPSNNNTLQQAHNDESNTPEQLLSVDIFKQHTQQIKFQHSKPQHLTWSILMKIDSNCEEAPPL